MIKTIRNFSLLDVEGGADEFGEVVKIFHFGDILFQGHCLRIRSRLNLLPPLALAGRRFSL